MGTNTRESRHYSLSADNNKPHKYLLINSYKPGVPFVGHRQTE